MNPTGKVLRLRHGTEVRVEAALDAGGQGTVYRARDVKTGAAGVYKVLQDRSANSVRRTAFLVERRLSEASELLCAPLDYCDNGHLGHFAPEARGETLDQYLERPDTDYFDGIVLAIAYCQALDVANKCGVYPGDIAGTNAKVERAAAGPALRLIDFDNFSATGVPPPTCFGQVDRMAPELRRVWKSGGTIVPDDFSDRFALSTIVHDLLLAKSVASGFDATPEAFDRAMSGGWPHDPIRGPGPPDAGGYPSGMLSADLAGLLRRGLGANREGRPSPAEWVAALSRGLAQIWIDPRCRAPSFIDPSKTSCPHCGKPFPGLKLLFPAIRREVICDNAALCIGRDMLQSPKVSALHAILRRYGPETRLQPRGGNGTFRWSGTAWSPLAGEAILQASDRLRFADVECRVEPIH
jgi:hypothetical protein